MVELMGLSTTQATQLSLEHQAHHLLQFRKEQGGAAFFVCYVTMLAVL